jgi:hypothetical protein
MSAENLASAVYEGRVQHHRHSPRPHRFAYRVAQLYLDLDEIDRVFRNRWLWSCRGRALGEFRRSDYLGPIDRPLAEAVRDRVAAVSGVRPPGPIRLLTHARYLGHVFNPVSFYFCFDPAGEEIQCIVAEVTSTPWGERHAYVLPVADAERAGRTLAWNSRKALHVSPFLPMERQYTWRFTHPGRDLNVHVQVKRDETVELDATLRLQRRPLDGAALARVLCRYPLMTVQVLAAIHWEALHLFLKHNPVYPHPSRTGAAG